MGYGLSGSGNAGLLRSGPAQVVTSPIRFQGPLTLVSDGTTTPLLTFLGLATDPLKQLQIFFDGFGNPIGSQANAGGDNEFGDRRSSFRPGDVFNADWQVMTGSTDNVVANAAGFRLGHGTSQGAAIFIGTGAPGAANPVSSGVPPNGSIYFRSDGAVATQRIYHVEAGAWVATAA